VRLHGGVYSGYTQKVRIALAEKGLTQGIPFVVSPPEDRSGRRVRNVLGLVPVLELDDGTFLPESTPIIEYLDALHPEPPLLPTDPLRRARMHALDHYHDQALTPPIRRLWDAVLVGHADPDVIAAAREAVAAVFRHLDAHLVGPYLVGGFSIADVAFMARLQVLPLVGAEIPPECSRARAWEHRLRARPSWSATGYPPLPRPG